VCYSTEKEMHEEHLRLAPAFILKLPASYLKSRERLCESDDIYFLAGLGLLSIGRL
jgi:hypothetical protein